MKQNKIFLLPIPFLLALLIAGCGGTAGNPNGNPAGPQATVETDYGFGYQNVGYTQADPNVQLNVAGDDQGCSTGININYFAKTTGTAGQATFQVTCAGEFLKAVRYPSSNCSVTNGTDSRGNQVYVYNDFAASASPPTHLPCGQVSPLFVLSPSTMLSTVPASNFTITGPGGSFTSIYGAPWVFFSDATGGLVGQESATSVSADGSSVTFSGAALTANQPYVAMGNYMIAVSNMVPYGSVQQVSGPASGPRPNIRLAGNNSLSPVAGDVLSVVKPFVLPRPVPPLPCSNQAAPSLTGVQPAFRLPPCSTSSNL